MCVCVCVRVCVFSLFVGPMSAAAPAVTANVGRVVITTTTTPAVTTTTAPVVTATAGPPMHKKAPMESPVVVKAEEDSGAVAVPVVVATAAPVVVATAAPTL